MTRRKFKVVGLFVFVLVFAFTMAACDMVGNNAVEDTARNVAESSETGELEIVMSGINMEEEVGAQSLLFNRFEDFQLEFYIEYQNDDTVNFTETISIDNADILEDNLGDISVTFTALRESNYDVKVTLTGFNTGSEQRVTIAEGTTEAMVIAGMKRDVRLEIQQVTGGLDITVDQFPSEATGGTLIEDVNVELLGLEGESLGEMDFEYGVEDQNLLIEGLFPAYYTMVISWEGHGSVREEVQVRVVPGKVTEVPITLFGSQLTVGVDWMAEPASPANVRVEQNEEGFLISWDAVENADRYNVLRKRTPYYHAHFAKVGEVEHTSSGRHEFQYEVLKPELFDIAAYDFQVVSVREHPGKDYDLTSDPASPALFELDRATAWGGDTAGEFGEGWWYYYDTEGPAVQTIWVNLETEMGTIEVIDNGNGYITVEMVIDKDNWTLQVDDVDEVVKVQGFAEGNLPNLRPEPAFFDHQFDYDQLNIEGNVVTIEVPTDYFRYFGIKLDVMGIIYGA
ncbi:hypothetical protein I0Q91_12345 [Halanaerobiaceae bacterium Z-7014]|uniref:Uncharacterized protein n=1 Tax=Halonatronomonas betaini TaxID=2778430 RepID=A0A931FAR1_9FIRM|nr:hypothetical protein [Halonatronomonas betaini]MBF8437879.1 hypothetical protein [Halonatronomonas betaini]